MGIRLWCVRSLRAVTFGALAVRSLAGRWVREGRWAFERRVHPSRRRHAFSELRRGAPSSVLFVCWGNICRSPYAAAAFARKIPEPYRQHVRVDSAGFIGPGRACPPEALPVAAAHGLDLAIHRSKLLTPEAVRDAQRIVVMEPGQRTALRRSFGRRGGVTVLGDLDPDPIPRRAIKDPDGGAREVFEDVYARIDRCVGELARAIGESLLRGSRSA